MGKWKEKVTENEKERGREYKRTQKWRENERRKMRFNKEVKVIYSSKKENEKRKVCFFWGGGAEREKTKELKRSTVEKERGV